MCACERERVCVCEREREKAIRRRTVPESGAQEQQAPCGMWRAAQPTETRAAHLFAGISFAPGGPHRVGRWLCHLAPTPWRRPWLMAGDANGERGPVATSNVPPPRWLVVVRTPTPPPPRSPPSPASLCLPLFFRISDRRHLHPGNMSSTKPWFRPDLSKAAAEELVAQMVHLSYHLLPTPEATWMGSEVRPEAGVPCPHTPHPRIRIRRIYHTTVLPSDRARRVADYSANFLSVPRRHATAGISLRGSVVVEGGLLHDHCTES